MSARECARVVVRGVNAARGRARPRERVHERTGRGVSARAHEQRVDEHGDDDDGDDEWRQHAGSAIETDECWGEQSDERRRERARRERREGWEEFDDAARAAWEYGIECEGG